MKKVPTTTDILMTLMEMYERIVIINAGYDLLIRLYTEILDNIEKMESDKNEL